MLAKIVLNPYVEIIMTCFFINLRPDGEKKAYVKLTSDYDAMDTANKVTKFVDLIFSLIKKVYLINFFFSF